MKKRRTLIISILLVAALALGIAYAAVDGVLIVDGKVQTVKQPFNLHILSYEQTDSHAEVAGNSPAVTCTDHLPAKSIMLNVSGMASKDDYVTVKLTIENKNDCTMYVNAPTIKYGTDAANVNSDSSENFTITVKNFTPGTAIAVDGTTDITLEIKMTKSCTSETYQEFFRVTIPGSPTNPNP